MVFTLTAHERCGETVLQLTGVLDLGTRDQLIEHVVGLVESGHTTVRADLAALRFMDSSGLSALLECKRACDQVGGSFRVVGAHGSVATVLHITGLHKAFSRPAEAGEAVDESLST